MQAPSNFEPVNLLKQQQGVPKANRSRFRKCDIYRDVNDFRYLDNHAIQVAQTHHNSFKDLIWHLVYSQNLQSDLDKARVIFRWMTSTNMYTINFQKADKGSPEEVLMSFKNKKGTYARIFETLCGYAGLYCVVITGFAKGLDYRPGDKFKGTEYNHSWNAVYIDGYWNLVDSHWATRYLMSEKNAPENLVYEYDDFYFLTDPEQLIFSHWSQKPEWQLLAQPLTLSQFEDLPLVKSYFFKCGMYFVSHQRGVINTNQGRVALTCGFSKPTNFTYKIVFCDNGDETYNGTRLKNFALQETGDDLVNFILRAPKSGSYYFTIFAQLLTGEIGIKNVFTAAAEYKVVADKAASDGVCLPQCSDSNWGPGVPVDQLGLDPSVKDAVIPTTDGKVHLEFRKTKPANVLCKLRKSGMKEDDLERCIADQEQADKVMVDVKLPKQGEYGLEVYGNDPAKDGDTYTHICQYFLHFAPPDEQKKAFYKDTPDRLHVHLGPGGATTGGDRYNPDSAGLSQGMVNVRIGHPGGGDQEIDMENLPPPPPELLQQQYLYGIVPDSRQMAVYSTISTPQYQGHPAFTNEEITIQPTQKGVVSNVPPSKPIEVQKRTMGQAPPAPPPSFDITAQKVQKENAAPPTPMAAPEQKPSLDILDKQVVESVDDHAIQVSKSEHTNFGDLIWDLIYSKNITNEIEKVRVIFRWLASKNLKEMNFDKVEKGSPEEVLMGLKTGRTTYAMVFETMCNYSGLHCKIISGFAKGADYKPGMHFQQGTNQHSWNAVYVYGTWCLVDCHWAARRIVGKQASTEDFTYQLDEYFFLPDPHQLIYTHFPDDAKWQLLERPITLQEFENMPHMKPQFFKYGLEFVSNRQAVIYGRGEINIRVRYPAHRLAVVFNFTIQFENGDEEHKNVKLNRYGMQESVGGIASFRLRLPVTGSYIIYIYAKEDTPENKDNVYAQVCEYKIVQEGVSSPEPLPFPPCSYLTWGAGSAFYRYNLSTYQQTAVINTKEGSAELQIRIPKHMQFMAKLKHNNFEDGDLEGYVMHRIVGNTAFFNVNIPCRGEYGFEIYGNDPDVEGTTLYHVAQYIIQCNEDVKAVPLPKLPPGYLGPQPKFRDFGLKTHSHHDPVIHLETNQLEIMFDTATPIRVTANLISVEDEKDFPECVFTQTQGSVVSFVISLPKEGFFKLQLYAIPASDPSQQLPGVYNYLINCQKATRRCYPFPKQYAQWKEGCYMYDPLVLHADLRQPSVKVRCMIPNASAVAIVAGDDWTALQSQQPGIWENTVELGHLYGKNVKVTLNANYGGDPTAYATLLEYCI